jgi:hypothetical protein
MSLFSHKLASLALIALSAAGAALSGCTTDAFCFADCPGEIKTDGSTSSGGGGTGGEINIGGGGEGGECILCTTTSTVDVCAPTNDGKEICDGVDNDCDGKVDNADFTSIKSCGTCDTDCTQLLNVDIASITCDPGPNPGKAPGTCKGTCAQDFYDLDKDGNCEYYCLKSADDDKTCDGKDDNCNGLKDEDLDLCTSPQACGQCNRQCVVINGTAKCDHTGSGTCDVTNTQCAIASCNAGFYDLDGSYATGCEYQCTPTNGGVEICDGIDNDCDGKIDDADDLSGDASLGVVCYGDPKGECATAAHAGVTACVGHKIVCTGPNVLFPSQAAETCNGKDDDCNGLVDDKPTDIGAACGPSNIFPCSFGTMQCQNGQLACAGAVTPQVETCNGQDDDCDGKTDLTGNTPPADATGPCDVPTPPPPGATSACKAGTKACLPGGIIACQGSILPVPGATDKPGEDTDCDGTLTNQPDLNTDVHNCGAIGNDCYAGAVHANWSCVAGTCTFQGCHTGYWDNSVPKDNKCEYACTFISAQEICNGADDNCNGVKDEGVIAPAPTQVCGVSVSATRPECTTGVTVSCTGGNWTCGFPNGVCDKPGGCGATPEVCDNLDNNCNGALNENTPNYNQTCASDDGVPLPGHGACRTTGTFVCNGPNATKCSAAKDNSKAGPELCDGLDNDCDGSVDEPFNAKGTNTTYYVKPAVTKLSATLWMFSYEASRPSATSTVPGIGNGYVTSAPAGTTYDKTPACSVPTKIPWYNVTPNEADQTCKARGGRLCTTAEWTQGCKAKNNTCTWGYNPTGAACTSTLSASKFCNLALGDAVNFGLLPTSSASLKQCFADWSGNAATPQIFDITGNLREITTTGATYPLMGGAFDTQTEAGATCDFNFYTVTDPNFQLYNTGFRCCFTLDPT